jgi:hypothetical protein
MPDPRFLYIVSAVVVLALVAWVIAVLLWAPSRPVDSAAPPSKGPDDPDRSSKNQPGGSTSRPPSSPSGAGEELRSSKPPINSHLEIQDEPDKGNR